MNRSMYASGSQKRNRPGSASYSAAIGVPRKTCSWWNLTVVRGSALIVSVWRTSISSVSPGSPRMKCAPTCSPRSAVIATARRAQAKSWPRFTARSVASQVDSMPYSIAT